MALKFPTLLKNIRFFNKASTRLTSQYYPIDEYIFGLTYEQIQVCKGKYKFRNYESYKLDEL